MLSFPRLTCELTHDAHACSPPFRSVLRSRSAPSRSSTGHPCTDGLFGSLALRRWSDRARCGSPALSKNGLRSGMPWLKYSATRRSRRSRRELAPLECRGGATVAPSQVADIGAFCPRRPVAWSSAAWWAPGWPPRAAPRVRVRTLSPTKPSASPAPRLRAMPGTSRRYRHRHRRRHRHPPARPTSSAAARKAAARTAPSTPSAPHPNCKSPTSPSHTRQVPRHSDGVRPR